MSKKTYRGVRLSAAQVKALSHRLEVGDAIADALTDDDGFEFNSVWDASVCLLERVATTSCVWFESELERRVLIDAVAGSTYFACVEANADPLETQRAAATVEALTKKIELITGEEIDPVLW